MLVYNLSNNKLIKINERLINEICLLINNNDYEDEFSKYNGYDITNEKFTREWVPHITIGAIRTPWSRLLQ